MLLGRHAKGWTAWKNKSGQTLDELKRQGGDSSRRDTTISIHTEIRSEEEVCDHLAAHAWLNDSATSTTASRIERQLQEAVLEKNSRWLLGIYFLHDPICQRFARRTVNPLVAMESAARATAEDQTLPTKCDRLL